MITSVFKFKKIQCFGHATEYMLVKSYGPGHPFINGILSKALIAELTMTCSDSKTLMINFAMRGLQSLDFNPLTVPINFKTNLLYPEVAFGALGNDGIIYEKENREYAYLYVYVDGKEEVASIQKQVDDGADVDDFLVDPEEWQDEENIIAAYEASVLR